MTIKKNILTIVGTLAIIITTSYGYNLDNSLSKSYQYTYHTNAYITGARMYNSKFFYSDIYHNGSNVYGSFNYCDVAGCHTYQHNITTIGSWDLYYSGNIVNNWDYNFVISYNGKIEFCQFVFNSSSATSIIGTLACNGDWGTHYWSNFPAINNGAKVMYYSHYLIFHISNGDSWFQIIDLDNFSLINFSTNAVQKKADGDDSRGCIKFGDLNNYICYSAYSDVFLPVVQGGLISLNGGYITMLKYGYRLSYNPYLISGVSLVYTNSKKYIGGNQQFASYGDNVIEYSNYPTSRYYDIDDSKVLLYTGYLYSGVLYTGLNDLVPVAGYDEGIIDTINIQIFDNYLDIAYTDNDNYYYEAYIVDTADVEYLTSLQQQHTTDTTTTTTPTTTASTVAYDCYNYDGQIFCQSNKICKNNEIEDLTSIFKYIGTGSYEIVIDAITGTTHNQAYYYVDYSGSNPISSYLMSLYTVDDMLYNVYHYNGAYINTGSLYYTNSTGFVNLYSTTTATYDLNKYCYQIGVLYPSKYTYSGYIHIIQPTDDTRIGPTTTIDINNYYAGLFDCSNLNIRQCAGKIASDLGKLTVDTIKKPVDNLYLLIEELKKVKYTGTCNYTGTLIGNDATGSTSPLTILSKQKIGLLDYAINIITAVVAIIFTTLLFKRND